MVDDIGGILVIALFYTSHLLARRRLSRFGRLETIRPLMPSLYVIAGAMIIASVANIYFNAISGTGNTQAALILEMGTLVFYALYILWIGMVVKAPVSVCFSIEVVYYSLLLLSSIIYLKKAKWQNKKI